MPEPTPSQIAARALEIRATWSLRERRREGSRHRLIRQGIKAGRIVKVGTRETRNGEEAETFMVASRVEISGKCDDGENGLI